MWALLARALQWASIASFGWMVNDVSTPDITLDENSNKVGNTPGITLLKILKWVVTVLAVVFIIREIIVWWKERKKGPGNNQRR